MNQEDRLKIQAWLDGELATQESAKIAELINSDMEAKTTSEELKTLQNILKSGEKLAKMDDSRDFYWSQIQRQIESEDLSVAGNQNQNKELVSHPSSQVGLLQWLLPAGSLVAISALIMNYESANYDQSNSPTDKAGIHDNPLTSGLTENSPSLLEDESSATPEVGVFSFQGILKERTFNSPEDPNTLPESIENPER
jgi:hypothetical protein